MAEPRSNDLEAVKKTLLRKHVLNSKGWLIITQKGNEYAGYFNVYPPHLLNAPSWEPIKKGEKIILVRRAAGGGWLTFDE